MHPRREPCAHRNDHPDGADYQDRLRRSDALDFDDILLNMLILFKYHPDAMEAIAARFRYILVDEYQDTNTAQFRLVELLAGGHRNLCVVGDDDQSIYKFRGANIENILHFEEAFPGQVHCVSYHITEPHRRRLADDIRCFGGQIATGTRSAAPSSQMTRWMPSAASSRFTTPP